MGLLKQNIVLLNTENHQQAIRETNEKDEWKREVKDDDDDEEEEEEEEEEDQQQQQQQQQ